jgi:ankyrin repeat protein
MTRGYHNKMPTNLGDLPPELVQQIAQSLDTQSLLRLAKTCQPMYWLLTPQIKHHAHITAFAPLPLYEENFIYDYGQRHGIDDPVFSLHASYGVPAGDFGPTESDLLGKAVAGGELDIVRGFLRHNLDPNSYIVSGERMLGLAVQSRCVDMARLLLEFGADASRPDLVTGISPLVHAARSGNEEIVQLLIEVGGDLNADRVMQLIANYCSVETVRMAIAYGGNLASISSSGMTVLHSIVNRKDVGLFNLVKEELPAVVFNTRNDVGRTALHIALVDENSPLAMPLACHPAVDIDVQDIWGYTALHLAIRKRRFDVAHALIQRGANVNLLNLNGENSLHLAVESGSVPVASMLIEHGADVGSIMTEFESALFWATHSGDPDMVTLFKQAVFEDTLQSNEDEVDDVSPL